MWICVISVSNGGNINFIPTKKNISSINAPVFIICAQILIKCLTKIKIVRMIWKRLESQPVASKPEIESKFETPVYNTVYT